MVLLPRPSLTPDESTHLLEALRRLPAARWSSPSYLKDMLAEYLRWWQVCHALARAKSLDQRPLN